MISAINIALQFGGRKLFEDVNIQFNPGNCYGLIGANGAGKSTFLKILSGDIEANKGEVIIEQGKRLAMLRQDHYEFDEFEVLNTVIRGHERLYKIMVEKDALYAKEVFTDDDGMKASELEGEFAELDGWDAESDAATLLTGLGISKDKHEILMKDLDGADKVKVLLAQALFGAPEILLLDEPTNHLDIEAINWLEEFLMGYAGTIIVVSHDRHFLNKVCTHIADIDFGKIELFVGNYDFWYESSQLALQLSKSANKKTEQKAKELKDFIARFSANASKSKQATSRKKQLDKLTLEDIKPSSRKYPFVNFEQGRVAGNNLLKVEGLTKSIDGRKILDNISFTIETGDKVIFLGKDEIAKTVLFQILAGEIEPDSGSYTWGATTTHSYFPKNNAKYFDDVKISLIDWLRQFSPNEQSESFIRGFLGRMLFSGEEANKQANVLSGGEKVRCMLAKIMLADANVLLFDSPTNHLDLESITAVNNGLMSFKGTLLLIAHDHQFIETVVNRVIEITPSGVFDKVSTFDEYMNDEDIQDKLKVMYRKKKKI